MIQIRSNNQTGPPTWGRPGEIFYSLGEARVVIEGWRRHHNAVRPHSSLGYLPPAPEAVAPSARPPAQPRPAPAGALTMADTRHMN